jgi:hypothetical protein
MIFVKTQAKQDAPNQDQYKRDLVGNNFSTYEVLKQFICILYTHKFCNAPIDALVLSH